MLISNKFRRKYNKYNKYNKYMRIQKIPIDSDKWMSSMFYLEPSILPHPILHGVGLQFVLLSFPSQPFLFARSIFPHSYADIQFVLPSYRVRLAFGCCLQTLRTPAFLFSLFATLLLLYHLDPFVHKSIREFQMRLCMGS